MVIDCGRCEMRGADCQDCVVTVLGPAPGARFAAQSPGYLPEAEVKALGVLAAAGLVPPLRLSLARPAVLSTAPARTRRAFPDAKAS